MLRTATLATMALLALLGLGCGSSDEDGNTQAAAIGKAEFVKRANEICKETGERLIEKTKPLLEHPERSRARRQLEFELVTTVVADEFENEIVEIEALGAPAGDEAKIERILSLIEPAVEEARTEPETYVAGKDYQGGKEHYGEAQRLAADYGIKWCPLP